MEEFTPEDLPWIKYKICLRKIKRYFRCLKVSFYFYKAYYLLICIIFVDRNSCYLYFHEKLIPIVLLLLFSIGKAQEKSNSTSYFLINTGYTNLNGNYFELDLNFISFRKMIISST